MRPVLMHTVLDAVDARGLASFYAELLGLTPRPGDSDDWLVLLDGGGRRVLAVQQVDDLPRSTWPEPGVPQQLHLDFRVDGLDALENHRARAEQLGATVLLDRTGDADEPLYVLADPAGHPFCLMVSNG